jgi:hypothetical protein
MQNARDYLTKVYLDWVNNYFFVSTFAEHNGITEEQAELLIDLAEKVYNSKHPDA